MSAIRTEVVAASAVSPGPGLLLGLTGLLGLVVLFVGRRLARWARRSTGPQSLFAVMGVFAIAVFLLIVTASGFRHYGGHDDVTGAYRCDAWWAQMGSPHGEADGLSGPWPFCKRAAENAIAPGLTEAGVGGLLGGSAVAFVVHLRRRRLNRQRRGLADASSSSA